MIKLNFAPVILLFQLLLYFLYLKFDNYFFLFFYFCFGVLSIFFVSKKQEINNLILLACFSILFILFGLLSRNESFLLNVYNFSLGFFSLLSANLLFKIDNSYKYIRIVFVFYTVMVFYYLLKFGISDPDLYNDIFEKGSRNYVSGIYIFILCLLILTYDRYGLKIPFIYPVLTFLGCVILYGRSGIIISGLILVYLYFFNKKYWLLKIFLFFLLLSVLILNLELITDFFSQKTSFSYGIKSDRSIMMEEYLDGIVEQHLALLLGADIQQCCKMIASFNNNPHNSFIAGHIRFGIIHTLFVLFMFYRVLLSRKFLYIFILFMFLSRAYLDDIVLFSPLDIVLFYLLMISNEERKRNYDN